MAGKILAIDTAGESGSIALLDGDTTLAEMPLQAVQGIGEILFDRIGEMLSGSGVLVSQIDCFATCAGPGSFTGVRVALAAAKGLAETLGRPLIAVSNLEALASLGSRPLRAAILDARRGDVYAAVYDAALQIVMPERVVKFGTYLHELPAGDVEILAFDFAPFRTDLTAAHFTTEVPRTLATAIGRIAWNRWQHGLAQDPALIDANYVRRSDAELFWKDK